jgi:hypothetical protein
MLMTAGAMCLLSLSCRERNSSSASQIEICREYPLASGEDAISNIVYVITSPDVIALAEGLWLHGHRHEGVFPPLGRLGHVVFRRSNGTPVRIVGVHPDGYMVSVQTGTSGLDVYTNRAFNHWAASYLLPRCPDIVAHFSKVWNEVQGEIIGTGMFERIYHEELMGTHESK